MILESITSERGRFCVDAIMTSNSVNGSRWSAGIPCC